MKSPRMSSTLGIVRSRSWFDFEIFFPFTTVQTVKCYISALEQYLAMLAYVRTPSGATCKGVLQLEATFIDVKNMYLHRDSNPGLWIGSCN